MSKKVVVLGADGFLGSAISELLVQHGYSVKALIHNTPKRLDPFIRDHMDIVQGDVTDRDLLKRILLDTEIVFHYVSLTDPALSYYGRTQEVDNLNALINVLQCMVETGMKKIVYPSSGGTVYGEAESLPISENAPLHPAAPYGIIKAASEGYIQHYAKLFGFDYCILRYANPYGPKQISSNSIGVIPIFLRAVRNGEPLTILGDGTAIRDYIYIDDAANATVHLVNSEKCGIYNLGSGKGYRLLDIARYVLEISGKQVPTLYQGGRPGSVNAVVLDISKLKRTGFIPRTGIEEGIHQTWEAILRWVP